MQIQVEKATKDKKWLVPSFIGVLLLAAIACVAISIYVGWNLTHKERKAVVETPKAYEMAYQDVTFTSKDGGLICCLSIYVTSLHTMNQTRHWDGQIKVK